MNDDASWNDVKEAAKQRRLIPFFGAGLSANLELPTWGNLMLHVASELGFDPPELLLTLGDYLQVAEYYATVKRSLGPLQHLLSEKLRCPSFDHDGWKPYELLLEWNPPVIYTTNFDDSIETYYRHRGRKPNVVSKVDHLRDLDISETTLIKFHGDLRYPEEIVITESQYVERMELESPMDLRFRNDLLHSKFIFMGYSFKDFNVRLIWHRLRRLLNPYRALFSESFDSNFIASRPNPVFDTVMEPKGLRVLPLDVDDIKELIPSCIEKIKGG